MPESSTATPEASPENTRVPMYEDTSTPDDSETTDTEIENDSSTSEEEGSGATESGKEPPKEEAEAPKAPHDKKVEQLGYDLQNLRSQLDGLKDGISESVKAAIGSTQHAAQDAEPDPEPEDKAPEVPDINIEGIFEGIEADDDGLIEGKDLRKIVPRITEQLENRLSTMVTRNAVDQAVEKAVGQITEQLGVSSGDELKERVQNAINETETQRRAREAEEQRFHDRFSKTHGDLAEAGVDSKDYLERFRENLPVDPTTIADDDKRSDILSKVDALTRKEMVFEARERAAKDSVDPEPKNDPKAKGKTAAKDDDGDGSKPRRHPDGTETVPPGASAPKKSRERKKNRPPMWVADN